MAPRRDQRMSERRATEERPHDLNSAIGGQPTTLSNLSGLAFCTVHCRVVEAHRPVPALGTVGQDLPLSGCLGIVHIPKSAGSAVRDSLTRIPGCYAGPFYFDKSHFGTREILEGVPRPHRSTVVTAELKAIAQSHRVIIGHYSARTLLDAGCQALATQVREPRARILSLYRYWQSTPDQERSGWGSWGALLVSAADLSFGDFLRTPSVWPMVENAMVRQLTGERLEPAPFRGRLQARSIPRRRSYIGLRQHLKIVEWSDRPQDFVERVCQAVGLSNASTVGRVNATTVTGAPERLSRDSLRLLERLTSSDRRLLEALMSDGILARRHGRQLDEEFHGAAESLKFVF